MNPHIRKRIDREFRRATRQAQPRNTVQVIALGVIGAGVGYLVAMLTMHSF